MATTRFRSRVLASVFAISDDERKGREGSVRTRAGVAPAFDSKGERALHLVRAA